MNERLNILVVEDNPGDLDLIREMLTEPGVVSFSIESAQKLYEAIARLSDGDLDLVLLDLGLPDSSGIDTFLKLKAAAPEVPAVILTGNTDQDIALAAVKEGAQDYLVKGQIDGKLLASSIRYAIERKRSTEALRKSEALLQSVTEGTTDAVYVKDTQSRYLMLNSAAARFLGRPREAVLGQDDTALFAPDEARQVMEGDRRVLASAVTQTYEEAVTIGGVARNFLSTKGPVRDAQGRVVGLFGVARDITERKAAEAALTEKESRYHDLVENSNDLICTHDLNGAILSANSAAMRALGYPADKLLRMNLRDILSPEKRDRLTVYLHRLRRRGKARGLMFVRTAAGEELIWDYNNTLRTEGVPAPVVRGMARDVTEQKQAEEKLARSEEKFRRLSQEFQGLLDAIPDSLMLLDTDLKVLWANLAAAETIGLSAPALVGRHCYALWYERTTPCEPCPVARSFTNGRPQSETINRPDGRIWDIRTVPLFDAQGRTARVIEVKRNITEHRKLEDQLRQAQKLEGIGQLAGGIAHDFNNVLGVIIGFAGVLQMKIGEGDPLRHYVDEIVAAGERGADITRQILMFCRRQAFDLKPGRLSDIVRGLEKMLRRLLPESIDLAYDLSREDPVILADAGQLVQVLMNLVTNARDAIVGIGRIGIATGRQSGLPDGFCPPSPSPLSRGGGEGKGEGIYGSGEPGEYAVLTISDTGHGMDAATRERIFEPFFTTKEPGKGTGLGLAVVHGIVKQHQGYVNVYSEVGKGTVIRIYLPLAAAAVAADSTPAAPDLVAGGSETILVAEDEAVLRKLTRTVLGQYGYTVIEADDGVDAVAKFAANKEAIRLVILDGLMPKMGGIEALAKIRRLCPSIKALFMSGYADNIFTGGGLRDKGAAFIQKPVMPTDLLRKVREVLDG